MKTAKQILEQYGKCCVSENVLVNYRVCSVDESGAHKLKDDMKLENLRGQKVSLEWLFE